MVVFAMGHLGGYIVSCLPGWMGEDILGVVGWLLHCDGISLWLGEKRSRNMVLIYVRYIQRSSIRMTACRVVLLIAYPGI